MSTTRIEIIPYLFYRDVPAALEWLARAFGFAEDMRTGTPSGGMHAEMSFGGQRVMMGQPVSAGDLRAASPGATGTATMAVFLYLDDVDSHHARAAAAGADIERTPHEESYGRTYMARDLEGHPWYFTNAPGPA